MDESINNDQKWSFSFAAQNMTYISWEFWVPFAAGEIDDEADLD